MAAPMGRPISVRQSPRTTAFRVSPSRFTLNTPMATGRPQGRRVQSPTAAPPHATATTNINGIASGPKPASCPGASGEPPHGLSPRAGEGQGEGRWRRRSEQYSEWVFADWRLIVHDEHARRRKGGGVGANVWRAEVREVSCVKKVERVR